MEPKIRKKEETSKPEWEWIKRTTFAKHFRQSPAWGKGFDDHYQKIGGHNFHIGGVEGGGASQRKTPKDQFGAIGERFPVCKTQKKCLHLSGVRQQGGAQ